MGGQGWQAGERGKAEGAPAWRGPRAPGPEAEPLLQGARRQCRCCSCRPLRHPISAAGLRMRRDRAAARAPRHGPRPAAHRQVDEAAVSAILGADLDGPASREGAWGRGRFVPEHRSGVGGSGHAGRCWARSRRRVGPAARHLLRRLRRPRFTTASRPLRSFPVTLARDRLYPAAGRSGTSLARGPLEWLRAKSIHSTHLRLAARGAGRAARRVER